MPSNPRFCFRRELMTIRLTSALVCAVLALGIGTATAGDAAKGEKVFKKCKACHVLDKPKNKIGPHLVDLFGRTAGSGEKFKYSKVMKNSGVGWDEKTLDAFLAKPKKFMKGTKMAFVGLKKQKDRDNLIAYLKSGGK